MAAGEEKRPMITVVDLILGDPPAYDISDGLHGRNQRIFFILRENLMAQHLRKVSQGAKLNMNVKGRAIGAIGSFSVKPSPQGPV